MKIQYLGHSCFFIKNKEASVVTDPFNPQLVGLKFPKVDADILTVSHQHPDHNQAQQVGIKPVVFDFPGEYEAKGVKVNGYQSFHDDKNGTVRGENIIFKITINNVILTHLGDLGHLPNQELLEQLEDTDVLLVPVGGFYTINASQAAEVIRAIKPSVTIPMHYNSPELNQVEFGKLSGVTEFLKLMGKDGLTPVPKLEIKSEEDLPESETVLLSITKP